LVEKIIKTKEKIMALQIELINLKDSKDRLAAIDKVLTENELTYHRQEAAHGHNIRFLHEQSGKTFTGKELAEGKATLNTQLEAFNTYTVTCDPQSSNPTSFDYKGCGINAGQMGSLCSNDIIWNRAAEKKSEHTLILQDNVIPVADFGKKLDNILENLPNTYDITFLKIDQIAGSQNSIEGNTFLNTFSSDAKWRGSTGVIISQAGIQKLVKENIFNTPVDTYYYKFATCTDRKLGCALITDTAGQMEAYVATESLLQNPGYKSVTETMGDVKVIPTEL
jgi:GR25 family glycosyltransferase involved in LPS biosynthesis